MEKKEKELKKVELSKSFIEKFGKKKKELKISWPTFVKMVEKGIIKDG